MRLLGCLCHCMLLIQNADLTNIWMHAQSIMESGQCFHCFIVLIQPQFIYSFRMDLLEYILIIKTNLLCGLKLVGTFSIGNCLQRFYPVTCPYVSGNIVPISEPGLELTFRSNFRSWKLVPIPKLDQDTMLILRFLALRT